MEKALIQKLEELGAKPEHLDEAVHQAASDMASNANNGGLSEQVEFLKTLAGWLDEDIIKAASDGKESR